MTYTISEYTKNQAKKLGVSVKASTVRGKKIDVYKCNKKVASIGAKGYGDYPTFLRERGKKYAEERRLAYKKRHQKNRTIPNTPGFYADKLLW